MLVTEAPWLLMTEGQAAVLEACDLVIYRKAMHSPFSGVSQTRVCVCVCVCMCAHM